MRNKHEERAQSEFIRVARLKYKFGRLLFAVPNGGSRNALEAVSLKRQGVMAGVADVLLLVPSGAFHGLCLEFKHGRNKQSPEQIEFQRQTEQRGYCYRVVYSAAEAIDAVDKYLLL